MGKKEKKSKKSVKIKNFSEISVFLTELADYFQGKEGNDRLDALPSRDEFHQLGITVKRKDGEFQIKYKHKEADPEVEKQRSKRSDQDGEGKKPSYKSVKKRMKVSFRQIKTALLDQRFPEKSVIQEFLSDSELMVSYPGYGDEYYEEYRRACQTFNEGYQQKNLEKMGLAFLKLDKLRQDCHDRYI